MVGTQKKMLNNRTGSTGKLFGVVRLNQGRNKIVLLDESNHIVDQVDIDQGKDTVLQRLAPHKSMLQGIVVITVVDYAWLIDALIDAGFQIHLIALKSGEDSSLEIASDLVFARNLVKRLSSKIYNRKRKQIAFDWPAHLRLGHYLH